MTIWNETQEYWQQWQSLSQAREMADLMAGNSKEPDAVADALLVLAHAIHHLANAMEGK